jgi:hypothetical protein
VHSRSLFETAAAEEERGPAQSGIGQRVPVLVEVIVVAEVALSSY